MGDFVSKNVSAVFALLGVVVGALLSFLTTWVLKKRESRLRVVEKILDRQIQAHEEIGKMAMSLGNVYWVGYYEKDGSEKRVESPWFMMSMEQMEKFGQELHETLDRCSFWVVSEISEELALLDIYFFELSKVLAQANSDNLWAIGAALVQDFSTFSARIQNLCHKYLSRGVFKLRVDRILVRLNPRIFESRRKRLADSILFSRRQYIENLGKSDPRKLKEQQYFTWMISREEMSHDVT